MAGVTSGGYRYTSNDGQASMVRADVPEYGQVSFHLLKSLFSIGSLNAFLVSRFRRSGFSFLVPALHLSFLLLYITKVVMDVKALFVLMTQT